MNFEIKITIKQNSLKTSYDFFEQETQKINFKFPMKTIYGVP